MNLGIHIGSITTGSPPLTQFQITQAFKMVLKNYFDTNFLSSSMYTTRAQLIMKLMNFYKLESFGASCSLV